MVLFIKKMYLLLAIALSVCLMMSGEAKADTGTVKSIADWISNESGFNVIQARAERIARAVVKEAKESGLDPFLVTAMIAKESGFNPNARSNKGAVGLLQVMPKFHRAKFDGKAPNNLEANVMAGTRVLAEYLGGKRCNMDCALKRYSGNARNYKNKVMATYREIRSHNVIYRFQNEMEIKYVAKVGQHGDQT